MTNINVLKKICNSKTIPIKAINVGAGNLTEDNLSKSRCHHEESSNTTIYQKYEEKIELWNLDSKSNGWENYNIDEKVDEDYSPVSSFTKKKIPKKSKYILAYLEQPLPTEPITPIRVRNSSSEISSLT